MLRFDRKQQNSVKQFSFIKSKLKKHKVVVSKIHHLTFKALDLYTRKFRDWEPVNEFRIGNDLSWCLKLDN